jgi:two-component system cell cycle response regulator
MTKRILIVDDELDIRELIAHVLHNAGYEVLHAGSGEQGLELLDTAPVDLVILDIVMQGMDGWDVCERMKANPRFSHIPVLLVTVRSLITEREEEKNRLADGVLLKPFSLRDLQQMVARLMEKTAVSGK